MTFCSQNDGTLIICLEGWHTLYLFLGSVILKVLYKVLASPLPLLPLFLFLPDLSASLLSLARCFPVSFLCLSSSPSLVRAIDRKTNP